MLVFVYNLVRRDPTVPLVIFVARHSYPNPAMSNNLKQSLAPAAEGIEGP